MTMDRVGASTHVTIQSAILDFVDHSAHNDSSATAASNNQALKLFSRFLIDHTLTNPLVDTLSALSVTHFEQFLTYLQTNYTPETEHSYFRAVCSFAATLASSANIDSSLPILLSRLTTSRRKKHKQEPHIPYDQIEQIRQYVDQFPLPDANPDSTYERERLRILRDKALIFTMLDTGFKPSEITSLRIHQLDLRNAAITLQNTTLSLSPTTFNAIRRYLQERASLDQQQRDLPTSALPLFARHDKRASTHILAISRWTVGNIVTFWTRLATGHSLPTAEAITPSLLRHHFVDVTLSATNDLALTQQRARHKDKGTTRHYLHTRPKPDTD